MQPRAAGQQLTSLLDNRLLDRLEQFRINASRRFTNKSRGEHLSGKGGRSIEFSDYRDYAPGDDIRFVDWNIFARLNRPYMKLYHQEEEMHVLILLDASESMDFEGKLRTARQIGAAFGLMGLLGRERVSAYAFGRPGSPPARLAPCTGRASMMKLFEFLEGTECAGQLPVEQGIESALKLHAGRGVAVVVSDFLTFGDVSRAFNLLFGAGLEIFAVQVLSPAELDPDLSGDARLVDSETEQTLDVTSAGALLEMYRDYRQSYERELATLCRRRSGRFISISSDAPIEWVLFDLMQRRGWIR